MPRSVDTSVAVQPDGRVLFTEVDLSEGTGSVAAQANRVNWVEQGGAFVAEYIGGSLGFDGTGFNRYLGMSVQDENQASVLLQLVTRETGNTPTGVYTSIQAPGGAFVDSRVLIDENHKSSWPKLPFSQDVTMSTFAAATGSFGGSNFISLFSFNHGLGKLPSGWAICADGVATAGPVVPVVASVTGVNSVVMNVCLFVANGSGASVGTVVRGIAFG